MKRHLTDAELIDLRFDTFDVERPKGLEKHLKTCAACRKRAEALAAKLDQLDLVRDEHQASETLLARTLRAVHGDAPPASIPRNKTPLAWGRFVWIGLASAAAVLVFTVVPPLLRPKKPDYLAALTEQTAARTRTMDVEAPTPPPAAEAMASSDEAAAPPLLMKPAAPQPKPTAAKPRLTADAMDKILAQKLPLTQGRTGGHQAPAPLVAAPAPAAAASPTSAPAGGLTADTVAERDIAADITVRVPSTSGTWLTGPQNAIRVRASRGEHHVNFLFVNQGSILSARIKILSTSGSNLLETVFLPPLAKTNLTLKVK